MSAAAWDSRWNLRAPASSSSSGAPASSYASWKRRVQALLEAESVWEVVSEGVVFDEAWPLPKQLEFIQKDKLGMHLILNTVHDSVVALLQDGGAGADECNRSWLMLKRLEAVFAAHRMKAVRLARREFLDLNFVNFVRANYGGGNGNGGGGTDEENDAMLRFIDRVQEKADALFRLRGQQSALLLGDPSTNSYCEDEKIYQLLDALPASWSSFIVQECEGQGDLTWASVQRKVLQEHSKRRAERRKRLLQQGGANSSHAATASAATSVTSAVSSGSNSRSKTGGANNNNSSSNATAEQDQEDQDSNSAGGYPAPAYQRLGSTVSAFSSPVLTAKAEPPSDQSQHHQQQEQQQGVDDQYDLRSPVDEEVMVYDFVGHQSSDPYPPQQQQHSMPAYQSQQQLPQDQYYDHGSRPKYGNRNNNNSSLNNPRNRRERDNNNTGSGQQRTPYNRPSNQNANANKICFYCSVPGHTAHHCPLKRMHMEERKKNNSSGGHQ